MHAFLISFIQGTLQMRVGNKNRPHGVTPERIFIGVIFCRQTASFMVGPFIRLADSHQDDTFIATFTLKVIDKPVQIG
jgi:hypothetical protein